VMDDPKPPVPPGRLHKESIVGVHHATEDDFRGLAGKPPVAAAAAGKARSKKAQSGVFTADSLAESDAYAPIVGSEVERPPHGAW
jgi:hypothetical protein